MSYSFGNSLILLVAGWPKDDELSLAIQSALKPFHPFSITLPKQSSTENPRSFALES